jgi:tetratricopeptide (TPR) repeat protein
MRRISILAAAALLLGGCAGLSGGGPVAPAAPAGRAALTAPDRERAQALEADGRLRPALLEWRIVRTIDPGDAEARAAETRLLGRIESAVAERVNEARASIKRGAHVEARRRLLGALALDPGNRTAFEILRDEVQEVEFVSHTVRSGDTLASLAQRYYGDRSRGEVIWETNQLPPNRPLTVGAVLKIPEIPGVPFNAPTRRRPAPPPEPERVARPAPEPAQEEPAEVNPLVADVREAVERKEFTVALADVDKLLGQRPGNREGVELKKLVLYRQGRAQLEDKNYVEGYRTLTQLARLQPDYEDLPRLLKQARAQAVEGHYREGLRFFRQEKLQDAIREWQQVLELEPQHANAKRNIEQAERLLRGLEQRRSR